WAGARLRLVNAEFPDAVSAEEIARCQALARRLGIAGSIEWRTEFLENAESHALLRECDVVVLPHQGTKESASGAVRVALASGAPVAVTPIPIFDDVAAATYRLPGLDAASIASGVEALLGDPIERRRVQAAAAEWAGGYAWPVMAERLAGMLAGLVATAAVPGGAVRSFSRTAAPRVEPSHWAAPHTLAADVNGLAEPVANDLVPASTTGTA
ncbi:MAG TPA: hypothetical protein VMT68_20060, partial [Caulobacteraceae bacterium]|nr:hypothetical protein [Caulobacteraceae bacterium]